MSGTTPHLGLPYPTSTDLVSNGAAAIQSLATALDGSVLYQQGAYAAMPATVPASGNLYYATDTGQLFVSNGTAWMAVDPLTPAVTSLPVSPIDGQVVDFVADGANGVVWQLRYRAASSSTYKWERIGGAAMQAEIQTAEASPGSSFGDCATVGPSVVLPLGGDYDISFGCEMDTDATIGASSAAPKLGSAATNGNDSIYSYPGMILSPARTIRRTGLASGATIKLQYQSPDTGTTFGRRFLAVTPVRCG